MEKLPASAKMHQQSKELISQLCMVFLMQLAEEANEFCNAQNKKTVCPDHVLDALTVSSLMCKTKDHKKNRRYFVNLLRIKLCDELLLESF